MSRPTTPGGATRGPATSGSATPSSATPGPARPGSTTLGAATSRATTTGAPPRGATRLIILRHGRTIWNAEGRFQGQGDTPLDDLGVAQAAAAAAVLAKEPVSRVVASDLSRARLTGQALADLAGLPLEVDPRLREIHMGTWDGLIPRDFAEFRAAEHPDDLRRSETGEHVRETADRVAAALREHLATTEDGGLIVAATHGIAGRVAMCRLLDIPFPLWRTFGPLDNCGWIDLRLQRGAWRIAGYNLTA